MEIVPGKNYKLAVKVLAYPDVSRPLEYQACRLQLNDGQVIETNASNLEEVPTLKAAIPSENRAIEPEENRAIRPPQNRKAK